MQLQDFYHKDGGTGHTKGPQEGPEALNYPKSPRGGKCVQLILPFLGSPGRKQPEPLPTVKTG